MNNRKNHTGKHQEKKGKNENNRTTSGQNRKNRKSYQMKNLKM
jgi:hypothetical protein